MRLKTFYYIGNRFYNCKYREIMVYGGKYLFFTCVVGFSFSIFKKISPICNLTLLFYNHWKDRWVTKSSHFLCWPWNKLPHYISIFRLNFCITEFKKQAKVFCYSDLVADKCYDITLIQVVNNAQLRDMKAHSAPISPRDFL